MSNQPINGPFNQPIQSLSETTMPLSFEEDESRPKGTSFTDLLNKVAEEIDAPGNESDRLTNDLLLGKPVDIHEIQIAGAQGDLQIQAASTIVSKVANAFQTLMNMQV